MDLSLPNPLAAAARARPAHPALITDAGAVSWRALAAAVAEQAGRLAAAGVGPGDTVALLARSDARFVIDLHAIGWLGAAALPLPVRATDAERERLLVVGGSPRVLDDLPLADAPAAPERAWPLDLPLLRLGTSGTTGDPRLITLHVGQLVFSAFGSATRLGLSPADTWLCCLPLSHTGGLSILLRSAWYGTTVRLQDRFDAAAVSNALDAGDALVSLVPTTLEAVLDHRDDRPFPASLRAILLGGAPASAALLRRCEAMGAPVARSWGMTEAGSQIATAYPGDLAPGAPALPFARVEAEDGLLVVNGPLVGGRLATSDRGAVVDGRVSVFGRADDVILSGGENIDPAEIEAVLSAHPAVSEVAVAGVADPKWGERPVAWVVRRAPIEADALRDWCRQSLPGFKVPDRVVFVAALPRTALGKVLRRALREGEDPGAR